MGGAVHPRTYRLYVPGVSEDRTPSTAARSCRADDLEALIGLLALLEAEIMAGGLPHHLACRIRDRLQHTSLLNPEATERDLRQAINDLNHRLRYALGEHNEPSPSRPVPD